MHREIQAIKAKALNSPWPKYLRSIKIDGLRGWSDQEVRFQFPVTAIAGENGTGKSTVLKVAASAYSQPVEQKRSFFPAQFFLDSAWDRVSGVTLTYKVREGTQEREYSLRKRDQRWRLPERPKREIIFQDISRTLPLEATAGYAYIAQRNQTEMSTDNLSAEITRYYSMIMGRAYESARMAISKSNVFLPVGVVKCGGLEYSQFHQGAGEDSTLDLLALLQNVSDTSLILIDEIEASLHPRAQRRLIHFLLWLARTKHIQVIVSTHSPYILEELPLEARIFLARGAGGLEILYGVTPNYALNRMDDFDRPDLYLFTEDKESKILIQEMLRIHSVDLDRVKIMEVGPGNVVSTLGNLASRDQLPIKSLGVLDGDQAATRGCVTIAGTTLAPEKQVFQDILASATIELAIRLNETQPAIQDALNSAMTLPDHHEWVEAAARSLRQSADYLWITMCQVWVSECGDEVEIAALAEDIRSKLT